MPASSPLLERAQELADAGDNTALVQYLGTREVREIQDSSNLALLYGTAQARLGRHKEGLRWLETALELARKQDERAIERRALNARGALAMVAGKMDEAADFFTQGLMAASRDRDAAMTGRCSNNLGILSHLQGRYAESIGSWGISVGAFAQSGERRGVAECRHNLGIAYRQQGSFNRALAEAERAVAEAEATGDRTLWAMTVRGRAEVYVARGEVGPARKSLDQVREVRSRLPNPVDEAEDLRVTAAMLAVEGRLTAAEQLLRGAIGRAKAHGQPQLLAEATRDLAYVLSRSGRRSEAQAAARAAKVMFTDLGAEGEIRRLATHDWEEDFAAELSRSLKPLHEAQVLADAGKYSELISYLGERPKEELERSPMLALLSGIGHTRMGRLELGAQWAKVALSRAQVLRDRNLEVRALNVCGAVALERGGIHEATYFFSQAQEQALQENDLSTVGRCANNLGIIANMEGDYPRAVLAYTRSIAVYQKAGYNRGVAEAQHNLGIAYREQGLLDEALQAAHEAVQEAERLGDAALKAQAMAGRAEIRIARREPALAVQEAGAALEIHRQLGDAVRESEDLRIMAVGLGVLGQTEQAEQILRDVVNRATQHQRPLLAAVAQRDLAYLLQRKGQERMARELALTARSAFDRLGATVEIEKLDVLVGDAE